MEIQDDLEMVTEIDEAEYLAITAVIACNAQGLNTQWRMLGATLNDLGYSPQDWVATFSIETEEQARAFGVALANKLMAQYIKK